MCIGGRSWASSGGGVMGVEDGDGVQVSRNVSKTEVVKDLMSHIKYFEFYPDSS